MCLSVSGAFLIRTFIATSSPHGNLMSCHAYSVRTQLIAPTSNVHSHVVLQFSIQIPICLSPSERVILDEGVYHSLKGLKEQKSSLKWLPALTRAHQPHRGMHVQFVVSVEVKRRPRQLARPGGPSFETEQSSRRIGAGGHRNRAKLLNKKILSRQRY